jgi:hypothetical protein
VFLQNPKTIQVAKKFSFCYGSGYFINVHRPQQQAPFRDSLVRVWVLCYDRRSIANLSWNKAPMWGYGQIFITVRQLWVRWYGAPCLTRWRVCCLRLLLAIASLVILGSETHGTRNHILVPQILPLAGLRWRYSTPPPDMVTSPRQLNLVLSLVPYQSISMINFNIILLPTPSSPISLLFDNLLTNSI